MSSTIFLAKEGPQKKSMLMMIHSVYGNKIPLAFEQEAVVTQQLSLVNAIKQTMAA